MTRFDLPGPLAIVCLALPACAGSLPAQGSPEAAPPHYEIDARVVPAGGRIEATATIRLAALGANTEIRFLLGRSYAISSMGGDGAAVTATDSSAPIPGLTMIRARLTGDGPALVRVSYSGPLFELASPPINSVTSELVELSVDSFWLPYQAQLGAPFTARARIVGLGRAMSVASTANTRWRGDTLDLEALAPTRDLAFLTSPHLTSRTAARLQILAQDHESPVASYYRRHGQAALGFLEGVAGRLPGEVVTLNVVRRVRGNSNGYARPGYVVVTETAGTEPTPGQAKFVAHELAHIWFGKADPTSEHFWLAESVAEYLGLRYVREALGSETLEQLVAPKRTTAARAGAILGRGRAPDGALYAKGPLLLFELESTIGAGRLDSVLRKIAAEPTHTTGQFIAALGAVAGAEVARAFEAKLR